MGGVERQGQLEGGVVFVGVAAPVSTAPQPLSADGASALHFAYPRTNDVAICREHEQSFGNAEVLLCCGAGRCNRRGSNERSAAATSALNKIKLQPRARALLLPLVLSMLCLSVIYDFADRECPQNLCSKATSTTGAAFLILP